MSGPKTSKYELSREKKRLLAEERKIERRKAIAYEKIKICSARLAQIEGMFVAEKQISSELFARTGNDNGLNPIISELEAVASSIRTIISNANHNDLSSVEETAAKVSASLEKVEKLAERISLISKKNEADIRSDIWADIDKGFEASFADIPETEESSAQRACDAAVKELMRLRDPTVLPPSYIGEIDKAINKLESISNDTFLKNYIALTVNPIIKKTNSYFLEYDKCRKEFEELYTEYAALCNLYGYTAREYSCCAASIDELKMEIQLIKDTADEDDEQSYISKCLDEVMTEMGYNVLGSREVTKRNGSHFRNELYQYEEGTAVSITYSSNGRITMELGGIDTSDRVPNAQETKQLCDSMKQFCNDFQEIEKRLLAKGVVSADRVSLLPPDAEYAQIINTTDYSMYANAESFHIKERRKSVNKQKKMCRE